VALTIMLEAVVVAAVAINKAFFLFFKGCPMGSLSFFTILQDIGLV